MYICNVCMYVYIYIYTYVYIYIYIYIYDYESGGQQRASSAACARIAPAASAAMSMPRRSQQYQSYGISPGSQDSQGAPERAKQNNTQAPKLVSLVQTSVQPF